MTKLKLKVIFLDCDLNKLLGRFNETRRIHPLSGSKSLSEALVEEMEYLNPIKEFSDFIIDTTDYSPTDLKRRVIELYVHFRNRKVQYTITVFFL